MMKSKFLKRIITVLAVISMVFLDLSGSGIQVANAATTKADPVFNEATYRNILVGKSYDFNIKNKPSKASYEWKSSNKKVATVNNKGVVKAVAVGSTTITCKITTGIESTILKAKVYVKKPSKNPATKVKINNKIQSMAVGETYDLNRTYTPSDASDSINWTSSNTSVAQVNANGVVTALKNGTVTIKATTLNKGRTDKVTIKVSPEVTVSGQEQLYQALNAGKASTIIISTEEEMDLTIPIGDYSGQELIVDAPNATIHNHGVFKEITILALDDQCWNEYAIGNTIKVHASTLITVAEGADCVIIVDKNGNKVSLSLDGISRIDILEPCEIYFTGTAKDLPIINVLSPGVKINTEIALQINASYQSVLNLKTEAASKSKITAKDTKAIPKVEGKYRVNVEVNGKVQSVGADTPSTSGGQGGSYNPPATTTPTTSPTPTTTPTTTPTPTPPVEEEIQVDDKGFTPEGRIVARYGTPRIDGEIDEVWKNAIEIQPPHTNNAAVQATATFKLLWDDNAIYVLAQVNDPNMTLEPRQAHEKDSVEIFLDENNDKTSSYGSDDLQFRVNYGNVQSVGSGGDLSRFYTATKTGEGTYLVEARIELLNAAANNKVFGMELQVNDGIGTSRAGTITVFDTTDSAWSRPSVFGEAILTGKKPGDVPGLNPYKLIKLIASADQMNTTAALFTASLQAAKAVVANVTSTQTDIDVAYDTLNRAITFVKAVTKAANMDLSVYQAEGAAIVTRAVEDAKELLAKTDVTADQINEAIATIDQAIAELKVIGLDQDGNFVAKFGSPVIDGEIDPVWDKVNYVPATASGSGSTDTTAKFKALWDDKALYVLADVTDNALDVTSGTVYNRDCVEIFLDEGNNALENIFDLDDTHYRISCENSLSADRGSLDRLYTKTKKKDEEGVVTGYILEARIALQNPAQGNNIYGFELQLNDARGGNRTGTLNVFDKSSTAYASPTKFGKVVLSEKEPGDVIGFNPYDLLKLVNIANDIDLERYTDESAKSVKELVAQAEETIAPHDQAQVDALYTSLNQAIKALVHKDINDIDPAISKIKEFRRIPAEYLTAAPYDDNAKGTVVREYYDTYEYSDDGVKGNAVQKNMLVYLPAGYNPEDKNTKYNVLYLIHGTSEDQNTVFGDDDPNVTTVMKKVLDMMIANGELDPMIVVTPYYRGMESGRLRFEIVNEIMPYIATKYNTYAASGSQDDLKAARSHHAVGGFSQGSSCTFTIMRNCFDYFKYYLPVSGGPGSTDFTSIVKGYALNDYYVFASTGTDDIAYGGMVNAIPAMADQKDSAGNPIFIYNADLSQGNLYLLLLPGGTHTWQCVNQYLYNILPDVFFAEKGAAGPDIVTNENGFTADGRIVAKYGTPVIDGNIDEVWNKAIEIKPPHTNNAAVQATATYKVLWDDNALYVLAQVKDPNMTVAPSQAHEKDSIEVFLDEKNDKTSSYGSDDLQFRVNYENAQSSGSGDLSRFYTATKTGVNEYLVEARVELQNVAANNTIFGIELQVNDGIGTSRAGTITLFDTTDSAWRNPRVFGEIVLTGKKPGDTPGLSPYKLKALIDAAVNYDVTGFTKGVGAFTARIDAANTAISTATTQAEMQAAYKALSDVMTFMGVIKKNAGLSLDLINNGEEVKNAVAAAEDILAKADATDEEMMQASAAIDAAIAGIGSYSLKDVYAGKFYIGAAVHLNGLADANYTQNLLSQYNSITAENDMKPEALLDRAATVSGGAIKCDFTKMDQYCEFAEAHGLKLRGHTFVWHSQTPTWFFKEGFEDNGAYVDAATMDIRLQQFMDEVFGHIKANYPNLFYAYDICNEVVSSMSMGSSNWRNVYGDYSFVTKAFEFARKASEGTGILLYYNDYNEYDEGKPEQIIALLADAKAAGNVDGIGMQSHVNIEYPPIAQYRAAIEKFAAAGYDIQITELDIATAINGNGPAPDAAMAAKQAQIYKDLFQCYIDYKDYISSVTLWGINDQHSWRGSQAPLIFDREYEEKDSYWNIISVGLSAQ